MNPLPGRYQKFLHRHCACVSQQTFKELSAEVTEQFLCYCCFKAQKEEQVKSLMSTVSKGVVPGGGGFGASGPPDFETYTTINSFRLGYFACAEIPNSELLYCRRSLR